MGAVSSAANQTTYGVLEMGGASAQIGFFEPNGDVMANLFKLQLGAAKHWNVYSHSFLYFGVNGAYDRLNAMLIANTIRENKTTEVYNPCLPGGSEYRFSSRVQYRDGTLLPFSSQQDAMILEADINSAVIRNRNHRGNFDKCYALTLTLMRKETNDAWCNFAHDRDCSFAGIYQPPLPVTGDNFAEFIATSNFYDVWEFLQLRPRSSLLQLKDSSRRICSFSSTDLSAHNQQLLNPIADAIELTSMCFRAAFVTNFLINGVGFPEDYFITALDVVNGQKVGWALGSMLYEINTLPWEFKKRYLHKLFSSMIMMIGSTNVDTSNEELEMAPLVAAMLVLVAALVLGMGIVWMSSRTWKEHAAAKSKRDDTGESLERSALLSAKAPINYGKS